MPRRKAPGAIERLPSGHYRVRLSVAGERHYFTLDTTVRADAEEFARDKLRELADVARRSAALGPDVYRMHVSALLDLFEKEALPALAQGAADAYRDSLKPIRSYFVTELNDPRIDSVRTKHIESYLAWRRVNRRQRRGEKARIDEKGNSLEAKPVTNRTLQKDRAVLHRLFALAVRREYLASNPVTRSSVPKADKRDPVLLSTEQYGKLLEACADRPMLRLYVLALGETGMRCESEALWLRWEDVDLAEGFVWIANGRDGHRTKSGKGRWEPMTPELTAAMKAHFASFRFRRYGVEAKQTPWIFHHLTSWRTHVAGERISSMRASFQSAARRAKLPESFRQHDLRHRRVTVWLAEGHSPALVQQAMGHADLRTTLGYSHLARTHLKALVTPPPREPEKVENVPRTVPR